MLRVSIVFIVILILSCNSSKKESKIENAQSSNINVVGAMKDVMWKGELAAKINLDTIKNRKGLYGIGPEEFLTGELLIVNGKSFISKVETDTTMKVEETYKLKAPFFVYANENEWNSEMVPDSIKTIKDLENYIEQRSKNVTKPFVFKLTGQVSSAIIHIQNLPEGATVSSPKEAHKGQVKYELGESNVEIVGFFSKKHKGVFTHHDTFLHMHLITSDRKRMGHLDEIILESGKMKLYLPKK